MLSQTKHFSLVVNLIGRLHKWAFEDVSPEFSTVVTIADLNDGEVLNNGGVKSELLLLELWHDSLSLVDSHHIINLLLGLSIALIRLQRRLHLVHVTRVFKERVHSLLTCRNIVDVRLGLSDLLL